MNPGDLLGTGTISAPDATGCGSLIELTRGGAEPIALPSGETRAFLEDGDEIALIGRFEAPGRVSIGFGPCAAIVQPARP
jgi:fumarylacetoacetase